MDASHTALSLDSADRTLAFGAGPAGASAAPVAYVDNYTALLSGLTWSGDSTVVGRPLFLGYSFETRLPEFFSDGAKASVVAFTDAQKALTRAAMEAWASASGLTLVEAPEGTGTLRLVIYDLSQGDNHTNAAGYAFLPGGASASLIAIDVDHVNANVLLHEIGHALGLRHPHEGDTQLDPVLDDTSATVMSYDHKPGFGHALGPLDLAAIRHLYGAPELDGSQALAWRWNAATGGLELTGFDTADDLRAVGHGLIDGRGGADVLRGGDGRDTLLGGEGDDTLSPGRAADRVFGGPGRDLLSGDEGDDLLDGGDDADGILGGPGRDTLLGGAGDDTLVGYNSFEDAGSTDVIDGGEGADFIQVASSVLKVDGGAGEDLLYVFLTRDTASWSYEANIAAGGYVLNIERVIWMASFDGQNLARAVQGTPYADMLRFGAGGDTLSGGAGADRIDGLDGDDVLGGDGGDDAIYGDAGADRLMGHQGADVLGGGEGNDSLFGGKDNDQLWAGMGDDLAVGDLGDDMIFGEGGLDVLVGGDGADRMDGGGERDLLFGGEHNDTLNGGAGDDFVAGDQGNDFILNSGGRDFLMGLDGDDTLSAGGDGDLALGNQGHDVIWGGAGIDTLFGGQGQDTLHGGGGDDRVSGDRGADLLTGGEGRDVFVFSSLADSPSGGADRIGDFTSGVDILDLSAIDADASTAADEAFVLVGQFSGQAGQAVLSYDAAAWVTRLKLDVNGDSVADFELLLQGQPPSTNGWVL